jgi:hypothetical protein
VLLLVKANAKLVLKNTAYFELHKVPYDNYKDTAKPLVGFSTSIAATLTGAAGGG